MTDSPKSGGDTKEKGYTHRHTQDKLDDALDDSFPASDPPSITQPPPSKSDKKPAHKPG